MLYTLDDIYKQIDYVAKSVSKNKLASYVNAAQLLNET